MDLKLETMQIIPDNWISSRQLADIIAIQKKSEFRGPPFNGDIIALSKALGPVLNGLKNHCKIEHNGAIYPEIKLWRKVQSADNKSKAIPNQISDDATLSNVVKALVNLHMAPNEYEAICLLAGRTIKENKEEFDELIIAATKLQEQAIKIGKKMLGTQ